MTAPTDAEIQDAIEAAFADNGTLNIRGQIQDAFGIGASALDGLYDLEDLRASELEALDEALYGIIRPIRDRAIAELYAGLVSAAVTFARAHPDAPRAVREPVTA